MLMVWKQSWWTRSRAGGKTLCHFVDEGYRFTFSRAKDGLVEIHKDQGLAENPMDRIDEKLTAKVFHNLNLGGLNTLFLNECWKWHLQSDYASALLKISSHFVFLTLTNLRSKEPKVSTKCWLVLVKEIKPCQTSKSSGHPRHRHHGYHGQSIWSIWLIISYDQSSIWRTTRVARGVLWPDRQISLWRIRCHHTVCLQVGDCCEDEES